MTGPEQVTVPLREVLPADRYPHEGRTLLVASSVPAHRYDPFLNPPRSGVPAPWALVGEYSSREEHAIGFAEGGDHLVTVSRLPVEAATEATLRAVELGKQSAALYAEANAAGKRARQAEQALSRQERLMVRRLSAASPTSPLTSRPPPTGQAHPEPDRVPTTDRQMPRCPQCGHILVTDGADGVICGKRGGCGNEYLWETVDHCPELYYRGRPRPSSQPAVTGPLVIHRKEHPSGLTDLWFRYRESDWGISRGGPGYGYEVFDLSDPVRIPIIRNGYQRLSDVRVEASNDVDVYLADKQAVAP